MPYKVRRSLCVYVLCLVKWIDVGKSRSLVLFVNLTQMFLVVATLTLYFAVSAGFAMHHDIHSVDSSRYQTLRAGEQPVHRYVDDDRDDEAEEPVKGVW